MSKKDEIDGGLITQKALRRCPVPHSLERDHLTFDGRRRGVNRLAYSGIRLTPEVN